MKNDLLSDRRFYIFQKNNTSFVFCNTSREKIKRSYFLQGIIFSYDCIFFVLLHRRADAEE